MVDELYLQNKVFLLWYFNFMHFPYGIRIGEISLFTLVKCSLNCKSRSRLDIC